VLRAWPVTPGFGLPMAHPSTRSFPAVNPVKLKMRSVLQQRQVVRAGIRRVIAGEQDIKIVVPAWPHAPVLRFLLPESIGGLDKLFD